MPYLWEQSIVTRFAFHRLDHQNSASTRLSALQIVPVFSQRANQKEIKLCRRQSVHISLHLCPRLLGSGLQRSRKAQKSSGSDHTGRDRAACIPAFLQIRPGKADYSDPVSSPLPVWVEGEGGYFQVCVALLSDVAFSTPWRRGWPEELHDLATLSGLALPYCLNVNVSTDY